MITFELPKHTNGESCIAVVKRATRAFTEYEDDVLELHGSREGLYALRCVTGQFSYALALDAGQLTELFASLWIYYHELPDKLKRDVLGIRVLAVLGRMDNDIMRYR